MPPKETRSVPRWGVSARPTGHCPCRVGPRTRPAPVGQVVAEAPGSWPPLAAPPDPRAGRASLTNGTERPALRTASLRLTSCPAGGGWRVTPSFPRRESRHCRARGRGAVSQSPPQPAGTLPALHLPAAHRPRHLLQPDLPVPGARGNFPQLPCRSLSRAFGPGTNGRAAEHRFRALQTRPCSLSSPGGTEAALSPS